MTGKLDKPSIVVNRYRRMETAFLTDGDRWRQLAEVSEDVGCRVGQMRWALRRPSNMARVKNQEWEC